MKLEQDEGNGGWPVGVRSVPSERWPCPYDLSLNLASFWHHASSSHGSLPTGHTLVFGFGALHQTSPPACPYRLEGPRLQREGVLFS